MIGKRLVVATGNEGKVKEIAGYFKDLGIEVVGLSTFPSKSLPNWEESANTFEENARIKASAIATWLNEPVLADDSGLCVDALEGMPGVRSARFAGEHATDAENNTKLLNELESVRELDKRTARFVCSLVLIDPKSDKELVSSGVCEGKILDRASGDQGFGYDPLFFVEVFGCTMAQLSVDQKNQISHRGKALKALVHQLEID